jgi:hypothetical protein
MSKQHKKEVKNTNSSTTTTTTTLAGLCDIEVIVSKPALIKENSSKIIRK